MPITRIEVKRNWPAEKQQYLIEATHAAMVEALQIPEHDKLIRFIEHRPEHFAVPPGVSENYTLVEVSLFPGRSLEAKRKLYQGIVTRFSKIGIHPKDIRIVLYEIPMDNWGIRGGVPASEVDIGFKVDV
ncbi:MAG TPA: tautomerase family protein [Gammaproteobacteria bacterium]|nr:tautomerase family protein [Gammaproteobacteria bacterium]